MKVDTLITLHQKDAVGKYISSAPIKTWYENVASTNLIGNTRHKENDFVDFDVERLIPKMISTEGPKIIHGDVNGDGLEDFYIGSAKGDTSKLFLQTKEGRFVASRQPIFMAETYFETTGAVFFDADNDGDLDLVAVSGGNEEKLGSPYLSTRLYINDGKGNFSSAKTGWPGISVNASCVTVGDFDQDGLQDLFIGARNIPGSYGVLPNSVLLKNNGAGNFTDVTATFAPELLRAGMVTDAKCADIDGDGKTELVVVGDWMPISIFKFISGKLKRTLVLPHSSGWWNCLTIADVDGNGTLDLIAGNFGMNSNIKADATHPARLFVNDFDKNGQTECVPVYYKTDGKAYPYFLKDEIESQIPVLKKKFLKYEKYAGQPIESIFSDDQLKQSIQLTVEQTASSIFWNDGKGNFTMETLPIMAQISPVFGITVTDLNADGKPDIFLAGNFYGLKPQTGRFDASFGTTLINLGKHQFNYVRPNESGLFIKGEARSVVTVKMATGENGIVVGMNNDMMYLFKKKK